MNYDIGDRSYNPQRAGAEAQDRIVFVRNVYLWLMAGIGVAGLGAFASVYTQSYWIGGLQSMGWIFFLMIGAQMGTLLFARTVGHRRPLNLLAYAMFTIVSGFIAGMISVRYSQIIGPQVVYAAAGMTAGDFLILTLVTLVSKKDFSFLRNFVIVGISIMFFGGLAAWIFRMEAFSLVIAAVGVVACSAKILYDTSSMLRTQDLSDPAGFALSLFVSLYNIFLSILRLLGGRRS